MSYGVFDKNYDLIVAGDGLAALSAALTASKNGSSVLLVGRRPSPGYEIATALMNELPEGDSKVAASMVAGFKARSAWREGRICPVAAEFVISELLQDSDVDLLLYSTPVSVAIEGGCVAGLIVAGKSGPEKLSAKMVIDATEDLSLCAAMGKLDSPGDFSQWGTLVMNCADGNVEEALLTGEDGMEIAIRPGIWSGEAYVRYKVNDDPAYYDLHAPAILKKVRAEIPALADAGVTAMASDLARQGIAPVAGNLPKGFLAVGGYEYTPAAILAAGEAVSETVGQSDTAGELKGAAVSEFAAALAPAEGKMDWDVLVAGGGTAGSLAAICAAREGVSTVLIEPTGMLGGITTGGGIHCYYHGKSGGIQDEMDTRTDAMAPLFTGKIGYRGYHPFARRVVLLEMAREAGVEIHFGTTVVAAQSEVVDTSALSTGSDTAANMLRPTSVTEAAAGSAVRLAARVYIDCTGDGDLAAMAGAEFALGRVGDGCSHAYSQSAGSMRLGDDGSVSAGVTNFDSGYLDPDDVTDLTRGRLLGLRHLDFAPWTDDDRWTWITPLIGLRQGRQIVGDYVLTMADQISGRRFDDAVGFANSHYDNHAIDYENESDAAAVWVWMLGQWRTLFGCEIPYRCMLPRNVEGVLVACRALSLTQDAHHQFRMQRDMQRLGEAAALAAVASVRDGVTPRKVDIAALRETLEARGCLRDEDRPAPAIADIADGDLAGLLESDEPRAELWPLVISGCSDRQNTFSVLKKTLESDKPVARFQAAALLAMSGDGSGVQTLSAAVRSRAANPLDSHNSRPLWLTAMILLGRCGESGGADSAALADAVNALCDVLSDKDAEYRALVAAVRALGRIAAPDAAAALRAVLKREDVECVLPFKHWGGSKNQPLEDNRWRLENACAKALKAMGADDWREIVEPHLEDERAYVRRAAKQLLAEVN